MQHILVGDDWAIRRTEDVAGSTILVELLQNGQCTKCAIFEVLQLVVDDSDSSRPRGAWKVWDGTRLPNDVEDEIRKAIHYLYVAIAIDGGIAVGKISFPRRGIFIPKYVMLNETIGIAIDGRWDVRPGDELVGTTLRHLIQQNWLRLRVLEKREAFIPVAGGRATNLDVDSPEFKKIIDIYFTFYHFRMVDGKRAILSDAEVRELMPSLARPLDLGELFVRATLGDTEETFADPCLSLASFIAVDKLNFCYDL